MSEVKDLLENKIYPNLERAEALADLELRDKGDYFLLTCPNCRKREAFIYKTGLYITIANIGRRPIFISGRGGSKKDKFRSVFVTAIHLPKMLKESESHVEYVEDLKEG